MPKQVRYQICILIFFFCNSYFSQNRIFDSLFSALTTSSDTAKVNTLNLISKQFLITGDYENAMKYCESAFSEGEKLNYKNGIAFSFHNKALAFYYQGDLDESMKNNLFALAIREKSDDRQGLANTLTNIGLIYDSKGNYEKALENHLRALKIREEIKDKKGIANSYSNIGNIYYSQRNFKSTLEYYFKSLKVKIEIGDKRGIAASYSNIGNVFDLQNKKDSALQYQFKALEINLEINNKKAVAACYTNIGNVYRNMNKYQLALENQLKAKKIAEEIGSTEMIAVCDFYLGSVYVGLNKDDEALIYLNKALKFYLEQGEKEGTKDIYSVLADISYRRKEFQKAFDYQKLYSDLKDTLLGESTMKQLAEMDAKYESERKDKDLVKKDAEIKVGLLESEKNQTQRNFFIAGFILVLIMGIFVFRSYSIKKRANSILGEKNKLIALQKDEVEFQKSIVDEKNKEMLDSLIYARRIQNALLASESLLKNNLKDFFILYKPKDVVSGDFYWASEIKTSSDQLTLTNPTENLKPNPRLFFLAVCDCTGHGVPGAFMSLLNISFLNEAINERNILQPDLILKDIRTSLITSLNVENNEESQDGMDAVVAAFNFSENKMTYAAANNPFFYARENILHTGKVDKMPVGKSPKENEEFSRHELDLKKNDVIYFITDGYADQFGGEKKKKFKYKQLKDLLLSNHNKELSQQQEILNKAIEDWRGGIVQIDDILIMGIKI